MSDTNRRLRDVAEKVLQQLLSEETGVHLFPIPTLWLDILEHALAQAQREGREKGFHEGKQFAIDVITKAIVYNPDIPMLALDAARKSLAVPAANEKERTDE